MPAYLLVQGKVFSGNFSRMNRPESEKKNGSGVGGKEEKRDAECDLWCTHFSIFLLLARLLSPLFLFFRLSTSRRPCPSQFGLCPSLFVSHIESRGSGRWWWWSRPDGGGYGGGVVGSFVPILLPISFLSLWEGEESPRSRALRTEFIIDRAISLTAPRRSWTEVESSRFCPSLRFYGSVSADGKEESITGITKVRDLLAFLDRAAALDHHIRSYCAPWRSRNFIISCHLLCLVCDFSIISADLRYRTLSSTSPEIFSNAIRSNALTPQLPESLEADQTSLPSLSPSALHRVFLFRNPQSLAWFCRHCHTVRDDRGKFAIRLFARAEQKIGAVARERGRQRKPRWKKKKRWLRRKRKKTCSWEAGKGEDCDGPCVGGVGGSGGRLFFYLSLTLRRERAHTPEVLNETSSPPLSFRLTHREIGRKR